MPYLICSLPQYTKNTKVDKYYVITNTTTIMILSDDAIKSFGNSIYRKVTAIKEVTTTLQHNRSKTIVIWTDSLSTLQALSSKLTRSNTVIRCHEALDELAKHNTVHIKWIAAHVGHWAMRGRMNLLK